MDARHRPPARLSDAVRLVALVIGLLVLVGVQRGIVPIEESVAEAVEPLVEAPLPLGRGMAPDRMAPPDPGDEPVMAQRPHLRSVSTAPVRPRIREPEGTSDAEPATDLGLHRPVLRLDGAGVDHLDAVRADADVSHAAVVELGLLELRGGESLTVAVVDPASFRPLAPRVTAQAAAPWGALDRGEALLSPDVAGRLGLRGGDTLSTGWRGGIPVAGSASNGAPPLADVVVSPAAGIDVDPREPSILVALAEGGDAVGLAARLSDALGVPAVPLPPAAPATAALVGDDAATVEAFAPFTFRSGAGGRIDIDPVWEAEHIVRVQVPILGEVRCHRLLIPQLTAALQHLVDHELAHLLDPGDYGGCYVPRHIDWNPDASLSMHAWGIALDVNVATNGLGADPQLDRRVVEAFTARGFSWGGDWRRPDGMHFELQRLLDADELAAAADG